MVITKQYLDEIILSRLRNPSFSVEELSVELGISRTSLWRYCKQFYNLTPKKVIDKKRLILILLSTYMNYEHIYIAATNHGIVNRSSFYNLTKKYFCDCPKTIELNITVKVDCTKNYDNYIDLLIEKL